MTSKRLSTLAASACLGAAALMVAACGSDDSPAGGAAAGAKTLSASAVSIPVLNEAGILQVSAANTAVGLTREDGAEPGGPAKSYPTGRRTYSRVVPADHLQAAASAQYMSDSGCTGVYILQTPFSA